jgi:hypothetical protein
VTSQVKTRFSPSARALARHFLGTSFSPTLLAAAFGASAKSNVTFTIDAYSRLKGLTQHPMLVMQERALFRNAKGELVIRNQYLEKQSFAPRDTGIRLFQVQVAAAQKLNVQRITTIGAGGPAPSAEAGYYLMARYGFDALLEDRELVVLRRIFPGVTTLNQLMEAGGKDWWQRFGFEKEMVFDLHPESSMMRIFNAYIAELKASRRL